MLFNQRFKKYEDLLEHEAIERGRAEGIRLILRDVLRDMTADRKAELPVDLDEKISAANVKQLRKWLKLLLRGAKPRQVFAGS